MIFDFLKRNRAPQNPAKRCLVAISGGVDSAVALALLQQQGWDCVAVHMNLWREMKGTSDCVAVDDLIAARQTATRFGVPFYVVNFEKKFKQLVVDDFLAKNENGLTPNPCTTCNREVKFGLLLQKMKDLGCAKMATGHYARALENNGQFELRAGKDESKDQSYFLYHLTPAKLQHIIFPLGDLTKNEVKQLAQKLDIKKVVDKKESQGACFYKEKKDAPFLQRHLKMTPGKIVDIKGKILGEHAGLAMYTLGQREGIGIGGLPEPVYVIRKNWQTNELVVGTDDDLLTDEMRVRDLSWIAGKMPAAITQVKIRYGSPLCACTVEKVGENELLVQFAKKQRAVTPGQIAVFYDGDKVLGGGEIF